MGTTGPIPARPQELLQQLLENGRGDRLRSELAGATGAEPELVEEALQDACARAVTPGCCRGTSEGEVYTWLRSVALSRIRDRREHARHRHELLVAWASDGPDEPAGEPGADVEVLRREKERELDELAKLAVRHMTERQRSVVALASHDFRVKQIARRLDTSARSVARIKAKAYGRAQHTLVGAAGGGCPDGERLISRLVFGTANRTERGAAQLHLTDCARCATLHQRLELFHQKIAGLLPVPATTQADPALLERALHKTTQAAGQLKEQLAENAAQAKQRVAETASQTKQQLADAASHTKQQTVARVAEYSPLAGARPAATATAIAGCLAIGAGGGAYCLHQNVNPIGPLVDAIEKPAPAQPPRKQPKKVKVAQQPADPPPSTAPPPPAPEPAPAPATEPVAPPPAPEPAPAPATEPVAPPPAPTPPAVEFGEPTNPAPVAPAQSAPARPAPAPASGAGDLYGP
jgi:RNA polymerase sigma factor (sigma-70 family)